MSLGAIILAALIGTASPSQCDFSIDGAQPPDIGADTAVSQTGNTLNREYTAILATGDYLLVRYSACVHFGMSAALVFPASLVEPGETRRWSNEEIRQRLLFLGKAVLWKREQGLFEKAMAEVTDFYQVGRVDIAHDYFSEFYFLVEITGPVMVLTIVYGFF